MADCPQSLSDLYRRFPSEAECAAWLCAVRWPDGFRCPACGHAKGWELLTNAFTWGMRRLWPADLGDRRHCDARLEAAAHRLVLGGVF